MALSMELNIYLEWSDCYMYTDPGQLLTSMLVGKRIPSVGEFKQDISGSVSTLTDTAG